MKTMNLIPIKVILLLLLTLIIFAESSCTRKGPFDYFEEQPVFEDTDDDDDDDTNPGPTDPPPPVDVPPTIEPGNDLGDVGQVVFTYRGETVVLVTVRLGDGSVWLQQNLGSIQVGTAINDNLAHGDLFQWGRWDDGHQVIDRSNATAPLASNTTNLTAPNPNNILAAKTGNAMGSVYINLNTWWNVEAVVTATASTPEEVTENNGADPCKALGEGWRLPTATEYNAVRLNTGGVSGSTITNSTTAVESVLKFTCGAIRTGPAGFTGVGNRGMYWSSTAATLAGGLTPHQSLAMDITASATTVAPSRRYFGCSIRCKKDGV